MLINLRNALMGGKRLPYDAEVEYLESTGTQWIDTGVNAKQSLKIRAVFESSATPSHFVYGVRAGDSTITCAAGAGTSLGYARWGTSAHASVVPSGLVDITQDSSGVIVNGTSSSYSATQTVVEQSGYTMVVFAGRDSATTVTNNMVGKFYSCKICDNGVLVRDYIPVRKGTVGYLYDRVSGKLFGNAGTGDFVLGPDVVPVEYIESHGTEYIDTLLPATDKTWIHAKLYTDTTANKNWFGADANSGTGYALNAFNASQLELYYGNSTWKKTTVQNIVGTPFVVDFNKDGGLLVNDNQVWDLSQYTKGTSNATICIFARYNGSASSRIAGRCYYFDHYEDSALTQGLSPVRVGTEGAMMDVLTRRIYRNAGTGAFAYGNDLKYPIPAE